MNKSIFMKLMKESFKSISIDKQISILDKMRKQWIPELETSILKKYTWCSKCTKYHLTQDYKTMMKRENRIESTYTDCGYGDDDKYGEIEYLVHYSICPHCGHKKEIRKTYLQLLWEKCRGE